MTLKSVEISRKLGQSFKPQLPPESPYPNGYIQSRLVPASVLIPMFLQNDDWHLLFIRRSSHLSDRHRGQVAYPGGRAEPEDKTSEYTALREAWEETGINPKDVTILGRLRDLTTITGYSVTPFVGTIPWPYTLIPQPDEVSRIFSIPLLWLSNSKNREVRSREIQILGQEVPVIHFSPYDGETLWGASARITLLFLEAIGLSLPESRYKS